MGKEKIKKFDIALSVLCIIFLSASLLVHTEKTTKIINVIKNFLITKLSTFYLWICLGIVIYSLFLCFSRYGNIRLGNEKPEYSTFSWLIMIFCTGMGSNLLYWSAIEWIYYIKSPPLGAMAKSLKAMELSVTYGGFHWSITGWSIYAIGAITLGLRYYNNNKSGLNLTACCEEITNGFLQKKIISRIIELIFLFGTIGGYTTMISFVVPMYCNNFSLLFGIKNTFLFQVILIMGISVIFTASSLTSLKNGIKRLSSINICIALILIIFIILVGPTMFIIKSITNSLGFIFQNFIRMSLWTDPIVNSGFPETWTSFYWAWWIGLAPSMWIFVVKISKGRKIKDILLGMVLSGSLGCWLYFGGISNYGLYQYLNNNIDFIKILDILGPEAVVVTFVLSLPFGKIMLFIWTLTGIIFLITTLDSGAYILSVSTTLGIRDSEQPSKKLRFFWSILLVVLPVGLMYAKAPMETLQAATVITSIPIGFLIILVILSGNRYLKKEIKKFNKK